MPLFWELSALWSLLLVWQRGGLRVMGLPGGRLSRRSLTFTGPVLWVRFPTVDACDLSFLPA